MSKPCRFPTSRKKTKKEGKEEEKQQRVRQQGNGRNSLCKHDDLREVKEVEMNEGWETESETK